MTLFKKVFDAHSRELETPLDGDGQVCELPVRSVRADSAQAEAAADELLALSELGYEEDSDAPPAIPAPPPNITDRAAMAQEILRQPAPFAPPAPENALEPAIIREAEVTPKAPVLHLEPSQQTGPSNLSPRRKRLKTRVLGFNGGESPDVDPLQAQPTAPSEPSKLFPCGWLAVSGGPGMGHAFPLFVGVSLVGRGEDQAVSLDFGDNSISRQNHAAIAYDDELGKFYIGHGGKSNIIRLNDRPVLSTEELASGDEIRIGETTLRFVALCGEDFKWDLSDHGA